MSEIPFDEVAERLTSEALKLFRDMADMHLQSSGDRRFIRVDAIGQNRLVFLGATGKDEISGFDGGAIEDLVSYDLLYEDLANQHDPLYRVSGYGRSFYKWLMAYDGKPVEHVEQEARRVTASPEFAAAHPGGAHHLGEAFELLWSGDTSDQVVSEIGEHLRKALMDVTTDVVGESVTGNQEQPVKRLKAYTSELMLPEREAAVITQIVELVRVTLSLDNRLTHIRDEADHGEPPASWEEIRRAAFATSFACSELDRLSPR